MPRLVPAWDRPLFGHREKDSEPQSDEARGFEGWLRTDASQCPCNTCGNFTICKTECETFQQYLDSPIPKPTQDLPPRDCKQCGAPFTPVKSTQVFCSHNCGSYHCKQNRPEGPLPCRNCLECGEEFQPEVATKRYCTAKCASKASKRAYRERNREVLREKNRAYKVRKKAAPAAQ